MKTNLETHNKIVDLYNSGLSVDKIKIQVGLSPRIIFKILRDFDVKIRSCREYSSIDLNTESKVVSLYVNDRKSVLEISKTLNRGQGFIKKILVKNNIKPRNISESRKIKFSPELQGQIIELYNAGDFIKDIAVKVNLTPFITRSILLWNDAKMRTRSEHVGNLHRTKLTKEQELEICKLYNGGMGSCRLGNMFHVCFKRIKRIIKKYNFTVRDGMGDWGTLLTIDQEKEICQLYTEKFWGQQKLRQKFHAHENKIKEILIKNGIKIRSPKESVRAEFNKDKRSYASHNTWGYGGKYKNILFRSLNELSFMIYLDKNEIYWRS